MKTQGRVVLLTLFFVGLIGLWWADSARVPDRERRRLMEPRILPELLDTKPDELRRIEIAGGPEPISLERRGDEQWRMSLPIDTAADPSLVETLALNLKTLAKSTEAGTIPASEAGQFGLDKPERVVTLWGTSTDRPIAVLQVGRVIRDKRYVRNGEKGSIEVVEARALSPLDLAAKVWRDRALFHLSTFQVASIEATRAQGNVLVRRDHNDWEIVAPWKAPADSHTVESLLASLTSARVLTGDTGFVADSSTDPSDRFGLTHPTLKITLSPGAGRESQSIEIGAKAEGPGISGDETRYARRGGRKDVLIVDAKTFFNIGSPPTSLRSKFVGRLELPKVDALAIDFGSDAVSLARSSRGWVRIFPKADAADNQAVYALVKALAELQSSEILDPKTVTNSGLDKPSRVIRVWQSSAETRAGVVGPGDVPRMTLKIGRRDALRRSVYVQAGDEPNVLAVPDAILTPLPNTPLGFRNRQILALASNLVDRFTIEGGPRRYVIQSPQKPSPNGWRLTLPVAAPVDSEALGRLLLMLNNLRVESFVADSISTENAYGFNPPWKVVSWTLRPEPGQSAEPPAETSLIIGALTRSTPGSRYARLSGVDTVFTLDAEQVAKLDAEWRDRIVLTFDPNRVQSLVFNWRQLRMVAEPVDNQFTSTRTWQVTDPILPVSFDSRRITPLLGVLSRVQAVKFVQFQGAISPETGLLNPKLTIEAREPGPLRPKRLRLGGLSKEGYLYATTAEGNEGAVFLLPLSGWEGLTITPEIGAFSEGDVLQSLRMP